MRQFIHHVYLLLNWMIRRAISPLRNAAGIVGRVICWGVLSLRNTTCVVGRVVCWGVFHSDHVSAHLLSIMRRAKSIYIRREKNCLSDKKNGGGCFHGDDIDSDDEVDRWNGHDAG